MQFKSHIHYKHGSSTRIGQAARQVMLALALALVAALGTYAIARAAVALSASMTDAIIGDDGDGKADPGEIIEYTVVINNSGSTDATGVEFDDNPDANTTFVGGSITASPVASNDTYPDIVVGNVSVDSALISYKVVSNDYLGANPTAAITAYDATSAQGGTVSMTTSGPGMGQFTYNPPAGYEGVDTFTYTLADNPNATSASSNRTATVSINISGMVWFINNNAASCTVAGCGRLSNPFSTLAAFNSFNNGTGNNPAANDNIFIYQSATQYSGAITLLSGQKLIGQDATASLSTISGLTPPSSSPAFPSMNSGDGTFTNLGSTVTLNTNTTVRGLQVNSTTSTGVNDPAGAISGVNVSEVLVNTSTGTAVLLSDASGTLSFRSISANGAASGISLTNTNGSFTVTGAGSAGSGGTLQNITGSAISLTNTSNTSFSYMNLTTVGNNGVLGSGASGFTMSNSNLTNIGDTLSPDEAALNFTNLGGTSSFTNSTITNAIDDQIIVYQTGATTLTSFTLSGNTFNGHDGDNDAIRYQGYNTTVGTVSIQGNTFVNSDGDFIQVIMENSANLNLLVGSLSANSFTQPTNTPLAGGITLSPGGGAGWNGRLDFDIRNNTISSANAQAVNVNLLKPATSGATIDGFIRNNTISNANNNFGGSIQVTNGGLVSQVTVEISGNTITGDNGTAGIYVIGDQGGTVSTGARTDVRVLNNTISSPRALNINAVQLNSSTTSANSGTVVCWDMSGNTLAGGGLSGTDSRIRQRFSAQVFLPGYAGANNDTAAVQTYITARTNSGAVTAAYQAPGGFYNGSCNQPTAKLLPDSAPSLASNQTDHGSLASAIRAATPSEGGSSKALFAPTRAGGIVNVVVGNLPAGKSVTIKFRATVNGPSLPLGTTQLSTQGTVSATNGSSALTDDTALGGSSDATITPVDRPDTTVVSLNRASANPTSNATVTWQVVFADAVDSLTASNFSLVQAGGVSGASITSVTETSGPPSTTWNITASTGSGDGTLGLNFANDTSLTHDVTNAPFTGQVYTIDRTSPSVTVEQAAGQSDPTGASPINFTVVFTEPVTGFATGDVTLGGTANPTTGAVTEIAPNNGTTYNVAVSGMANDGTVTASVGANKAQDAAGNNNNASTSTDNTVLYDSAPPSVTIDQAAGQPDPTSSSPINFTVVFTEAVTGFATGDVTLGGAANPTTAVVTEIAPNDGTTYNVAVSGMTNNGAVTATIGAGVALDAGNNGNTASTSGDNSVTFVPPTDLSITKTDGVTTATPGGSVTYTITASNAGPNADPGAIVADTLPASLTANWTCVGAGGGTCTASGSGNINDTVNLPVGGSVTYTVSATISAAATGTLSNTATVTASASVADTNPANNSATDTDTLTAQADLAITKTDGVTTAVPGGSVTYTIIASNAGPSDAPTTTVADTFPASLTANWTCVGVGGGTCTAAGSGNINDTVNLPAGGSVTYTVSATISAAATGTLVNTATVSSSTTDSNFANNSATDSDTLTRQADLAITKTDGVTVAVPGGSVTYTITASNPGPSNAPGSTVADTLPASLSGATWTCVGAGGGTCTAAGSGNISDTVNLPAGGSVTYTVSATLSISATGSLSNTATVAAPGGVTDPVPGNNSATDTDTIAPPVDVSIEQAGSQADPTNASAINFTVVFGSAVTDFDDPTDVTLSGTAGATTITITGGPTTYNVAVSGMTGDGTVIAVIPSGAAQGSLGEPNAASTSTDNTVTYDGTAPSVTVEQASGQPDPTGLSPIHFTVVFGEPVSGFASGDVTVGGGSNPTTGTVTEIAPNDGTTYDVAVSGMANDGTVTASVDLNKAQDAAGNGNAASTSTDNSVVYDTVVPSVTIDQAAGQPDPTNGGTIHFTAVFSEPVSGFATGDVTLGGTAGATTGTVTEIAPNDGTTYDVAVSGMTNDGTVTASIDAAKAQDAGNNDNTASTSGDNIVTYDATAPSVTVEQASGQADPTNGSPVNFTVVFSEPVTGFATGDVTLGGTANPTTGTVIEIAPNDGTTYNVAVSGMANDGTITASVGLNKAQDAAGNSNAASTSTDNTVTYDSTAPSVTVEQASGQPDPTGLSPIHFTVVFSEPVSGFASGDVTVGGGSNPTTGTVTEIAPNDGTTYDVAVSGMANDGTVTASVDLNKAQDAAGNGNAASTSTDNSVVYDTVVPSVTIDQASIQVDPTNGGTIHFTAVFSEPVTGFATGDVTLGGTAGATTGAVTEIAPNDGTTYDVAVSGMTNDGTVTASIDAAKAQDAGNNDNTPSTSGDNIVTYDATAPSVTVEQAGGQADPTHISPVNFTVVFTEPVTGFATGDVTLGGTAGATTGAITEIAPNDGTTYNVAVSGMTTGGTVIASIGASVAQDAAGNSNAASTSTDNTVDFTFNTTTTITSDTPDPSIVGEAVTFTYTVTVNDGGSGTPTGNVTVTDGTNSCTDTVAAGACTITFTTLGSKTLTATYAGDANFNTSTSASVSHQVNNANTTTTITADAPDPSMVGAAFTVNFTVAVVAPGTGTPTGNVTVTDGVDSCIGTVASGSCSITLTTPGLRNLTASYAGDANFGSSTSAAENHTVNEAPAITSPDHITFMVQTPGSFTVLTSGFPIPALTQTGALPGGVTFVDNHDGTATLSGTPDLGTSGDYPLTFTAANGTTDATQNFTLTISVDPIFEDVPNDFWAAPYINAIYYAGITGGCTSSPMNFCPNASITRAQMAVFLKRGIHGSSYQPPLPASFHFNDIIGHWAQNWIEDLYSEGITGGCGLSPFSYCPDQPVTRAQMAVFLLLLRNGASYTPPPASGAVFTDVPDTQWAAAWIEQLAAEGITAGCGGGRYCPNAPVTRAEMAVLIVTTLNLVLP